MTPAVLQAPEFLTAAVCRAVRQQYAGRLRKGLTPRGTTATDADLRLVNPAIVDAVGKRVAAALREAFGLCPLKLDYAAYARILPGGSHELHADGFKLNGEPNHTANRIATGIVYLTDHGTDHDGGLIRFPDVPLEVEPRAGLLVGMLASLGHRHEVTTVTRGERDALIFWFHKDCGCGCR